MPFNVPDPEQIRKIASIIKSRCRKAGHTITLSACRDIASRLHGYLGWSHYLKRSSSVADELPGWASLKGLFTSGLLKEDLPPELVAEIIAVLDEHFKSSRGDSGRPYPDDVKAMRQELDRLYAEGDFETLHAAILGLPVSIIGKLDPPFYAMVDEIVRRRPSAAFSLADIVPESGSAETDLQAKLARLRLALTSSATKDPHLHLAIALLLLKAKKVEALEHIHKALSADCEEAYYLAGFAYETGSGQSPDLRKAMQYYLEGFEVHDNPECKLSVARLLLTDNDLNPNDYKYDAVGLLEELSLEESDEGLKAEAMLETLREARSLPRVLPETVTPQGSKRPKLIRDALKSYFRITSEEAEGVTAALHGFESWARLLNASNDLRRVKGKFDEDCDAPAFIARKKALVGVLRMHTDLDDYQAEIAISLLKPTAREGRPSLRKLEKTASGRLFPFSSDTIREGMQDFMSKVGFDGSTDDFFSLLRAGRPIDPEVWCEYLRDTCKWDIQEIRPSPTASGSKVAVVRGRGREFNVYMMSVTYEPGDRTDLLVDQAMKDIDRAGGDAILLFSRALVFPGRLSESGLLYGGRIKVDDRWSDFTVRPDCRIEGVLDQAGLFQYPPRDEFIERFGFPGFLEAGAWIEANSAEGPNGPVNFELLRMASGWRSYLRAS